MTLMQTDDDEAKRQRQLLARREYNARYRAANRERIAEQNKRWRDANSESGYLSEWRKKRPDYARLRYAANKEHIQAQQRAYYIVNAEIIKARNREYSARPESKIKARRRMLAKKYGMSSEEYMARGDALKWCCQSCGGEPNTLGLVVDHDHATGAVRGLLCSKCNSGLGLLGDSTTKVAALLRYMRTHERLGRDEAKK